MLNRRFKILISLVFLLFVLNGNAYGAALQQQDAEKFDTVHRNLDEFLRDALVLNGLFELSQKVRDSSCMNRQEKGLSFDLFLKQRNKYNRFYKQLKTYSSEVAKAWPFMASFHSDLSADARLSNLYYRRLTQQLSAEGSYRSAFYRYQTALDEMVTCSYVEQLVDLDEKKVRKSLQAFVEIAGQVTGSLVAEGHSLDLLRTELQQLMQSRTEAFRLAENGKSRFFTFSDLRKSSGLSTQDRQLAGISVLSQSLTGAGLLAYAVNPPLGLAVTTIGTVLYSATKLTQVHKKKSKFHAQLFMEEKGIAFSDPFGTQRRIMRRSLAVSNLKVPLHIALAFLGIQRQVGAKVIGLAKDFSLAALLASSDFRTIAAAVSFGRVHEYVAYRQKGLKPLQDPIFYANSLRDILSDSMTIILFGQAEGLAEIPIAAVSNAVYSIVLNDVTEGVTVLAGSNQDTLASAYFDFLWSVGPKPLYESLFFGASKVLVKLPFLRALGNIDDPVKLITTLLLHATEEPKLHRAKIEFLHENRSFFHAIKLNRDLWEELPFVPDEKKDH